MEKVAVEVLEGAEDQTYVSTTYVWFMFRVFYFIGISTYLFNHNCSMNCKKFLTTNERKKEVWKRGHECEGNREVWWGRWGIWNNGIKGDGS